MSDNKLNGKLKQVQGLQGKEYWRGLDELAETPEFKEFLHREFPAGASELSDGVSRRTFLKLMGASLAFAGLSGCRRPVEKIVPYVVAPEEIIPGIAQYYATSMPLGLDAYGMLVKSNEGRPTKIEGNPKHPSSLGKTDAIMQAQLLGLYDPDRSRAPLQKGGEKLWIDFISFWRTLHPEYLKNRGAGVAVVSRSFASPTLARLKQEFMARLPLAQWVVYEPVSDEQILAGVRIATGKELRPVHDLAKAKVVLALDADPLLQEGDHVAAINGFSAGRRLQTSKDAMNRLYVVEPHQTVTGGVADHRMRLQSRQIPAFTAALALALQEQGIAIPAGLLSGLRAYNTNSFDRVWIRSLAKDLAANRGNSLVIAGRRQPTAVHALVVALNQALGAVGRTITYRPLLDSAVPNSEAFAALTKQMQAGKIATLVILGGNPVYDAPADLEFGKALEKVSHSIQLATYADETAKQSEWHLPEAHFLESWGDTRAASGAAAVVQPLIAPLFAGHTAAELLALLTTGEEHSAYDLTRETWKRLMGGVDFEKRWTRVLNDGVLEASEQKGGAIAVNEPAISQHLSKHPFPLDAATAEKLEIVFTASNTLLDGRFANIGWLQELPDPATMLTWDNAALLSPKTAAEKGVENEDLVKLAYNGKQLSLPVWIVPGCADNTVAVALGYGRLQAGRVGNKVGADVYPLRTTKAMHYDIGLTLAKSGGRYKLSTTQLHGSMEGRALVREASLAEYRKRPEFAKEMVEIPPVAPLFKEIKYDSGYQWGMAIDLNACVGCGACSIACQSENNIPVVGKKQVRLGREMSWLRVDRYYAGSPEEAQMVHQPVACQHCENAPCEQVCPVAATVHDSEGLNVMTYNRCIGTRYCANNCPYKVRRFNFLNFTSDTPEIVKMAQNPDVTVRFRGVMEKCTFCVQRLSGAKINAKKEGRKVRDGEIKTACQQACPADAITFGDINDPQSRVAKQKEADRNYLLLGEINTKPRNSYLARIRNPNPEITPPVATDSAQHE